MRPLKIIYFMGFMVLGIWASSSYGELTISHLKVEPLLANDIIVRYAWKVDVSSDEEGERHCDLKISFFDASGSVILSKTVPVSVSRGKNPVSGHGVCKPEIWDRIKEYRAIISCP